jgi:hypothetical protein
MSQDKNVYTVHTVTAEYLEIGSLVTRFLQDK